MRGCPVCGAEQYDARPCWPCAWNLEGEPEERRYRLP